MLGIVLFPIQLNYVFECKYSKNCHHLNNSMHWINNDIIRCKTFVPARVERRMVIVYLKLSLKVGIQIVLAKLFVKRYRVQLPQ